MQQITKQTTTTKVDKFKIGHWTLVRKAEKEPLTAETVVFYLGNSRYIDSDGEPTDGPTLTLEQKDAEAILDLLKASLSPEVTQKSSPASQQAVAPPF